MQSVACGAWHSVALSTTGDLYGWGWNRFGQLGTDTTLVPLPRLLPPVFLAAAAGHAPRGRQGEEEVSFEQVSLAQPGGEAPQDGVRDTTTITGVIISRFCLASRVGLGRWVRATATLPRCR